MGTNHTMCVSYSEHCMALNCPYEIRFTALQHFYLSSGFLMVIVTFHQSPKIAYLLLYVDDIMLTVSSYEFL